MSLLFTMLSKVVMVFLPRIKRLLISGLPSPSAVILELEEIKSVTVSIVSLSICHEVMGLDAMILVFEILSFPWKEGYEQPRWHIQKQRHYFAKKGSSSQGYGFSCGHVWMRELDCEEG